MDRRKVVGTQEQGKAGGLRGGWSRKVVRLTIVDDGVEAVVIF